jgi:peptide/nickel transport system substrate-binding protein
MKKRSAIHLLSLLALLVVVGCTSASPSGLPSGSADAPSSTRAPKVITIGMQLQQEPVSHGSSTGIINITGPGTGGGSGQTEHRLMFHAGLTVFDDHSVLQPRLAATIPALDDGTWTVAADGSMELTWTLKPNLFWHDGAPLTAADFVLGTQIARDPDVAGDPPAIGTRQLTEVLAPDEHTLVVRFPQPFGAANLGDNTPALPTHLLGDLYARGDKQSIQNSTYWTTDFVGLGPFKLGQWVQGSFLEGLAFDQYVLGRPKLDRIIVRYYGDANTMVAALMAGEVDVLPAGAQLDTRPLSTIRQAWGPSGGTVLPIPKGTRNLIPQLRDPTKPWARDVRARQALAYGLDKQLIVDTLQDGQTTPAFTSITPGLPAYQRLEQLGAPKYEHDPAQAQRLLGEAGWTKAGDGIYRNAAGEPFAFDIMSSNQPKNVQESTAVAGQYSELGLTAKPNPYPAAASNAVELRMTDPGMLIWPATNFTSALDGFSSQAIGTEQNHWRGNNYGGYRSDDYDRLYREFGVTLEPSKSQDLAAQMMKIVADEVAAIPMYYAALGVAFRAGIIGPGGAPPEQAANAWNIHTWDLRS